MNSKDLMRIDRETNVNSIVVGMPGEGFPFAKRLSELRSPEEDLFSKSHNWRKMHGIPMKTPRLVRLSMNRWFSKRSKRKKARYHEKHILNPFDMDIDNPRIRKAIKRYRCEPKKLRRKLRRILLSEKSN